MLYFRAFWGLFMAGCGAHNIDRLDSYVSENYGVDVSYPITHFLDPNTYQGKRYEAMMQGCYEFYSYEECMRTEIERLKMSIEQPRSQFNYTDLGFQKLKLPQNVWQELSKFYEENKDKGEPETWSRGYTYTNHWESPTFMVSVENLELPGAGPKLKQLVWEGVSPIIEAWTGHKLKPTSQYGIRIYTNNSILATHVDRLPLVSSCIINVGQEDLEEPWPIEVYDHSGKAHNVTMEPGDMVLYESSTILHGRPFPLRGKAYANIFVHFEPIDHHQMNAEALQANKIVTHDHVYTLNIAAAKGQLSAVQELLKVNRLKLFERDANGWQPLHEAARAGHLEVVKYLIEQGADANSLTLGGETPLFWAKSSLGDKHPVVSYLETLLAKDKIPNNHVEEVGPQIGEL